MLKYEEKASGIETNISEVELLLEQLIEYEDAAEGLQKANIEENKNKAMEDRKNARICDWTLAKTGLRKHTLVGLLQRKHVFQDH